ncbi:hypothetical protein Tco_1433289 [Tanacetum coccineum]
MTGNKAYLSYYEDYNGVFMAFGSDPKGGKITKSTPTTHTDQVFDDVDVNDAIDYMKTEDDHYEERTSAEKGVSTEDKLSTDKPKVSTDKPEVGTDQLDVSTDKPNEGTAKPDEGTAKAKDGNSEESSTLTNPTTTSTPTKTVFKDDETIAEFLVSMSQIRQNKKALRSKMLKIQIDQGLHQQDRCWGVDEAERKFDQLAKDEEIARKVQGFKRKRETFTVEERAKFLYDIIAAERRFIAQQRAAAIRSKPPIRTQLRNQMMTYLKHVGGKKHADLKNKNFEEIQVLYKKVKRYDKDFIAIGSAKDERQIKEMNEESKDPKKKRLKKRVVNETTREEDIAKVPAEQEVTEQGTKKRKSGHMKMIARKRPRPQPDDDEHRKCLRIVTFNSTIDSEIMEIKSFVSKLHKVSSPDGDYLVVYRVNGHFRAFNYLMEVLHIFDRQDLFHLYDLVMKQYSEITPEGIKLILWEDLKIMMESSTEENDQGDFLNNQQDWEIVSWRLYEACGVCILELKDGTVIYMLVERRYPLSKELLQRMLDLGLEVEEESTSILHLKQMASGKDFSNPFMVDNLPKIVWFSTHLASQLSIHLVVYNEELAIPEQTATGKGISNPLMAGSLPKTTKPT